MARQFLTVSRILWSVGALAVLTACGGGSASGPTYSLGGTVSGLVGSGLQLSDNGGSALAVSANGFFTIATSVAPGAAYSISVLAQPQNPPQTCVVRNGSGTMGSAPVTSVSVVCTTNSFTVGGTVAGLQGEGLVLQNNGTDNLAVTQNGALTFSTPIAVGAAYAVTVKTQPSAPLQTCAVTNGLGTMGTANITNVAISCTNNFPAIYTVSANVSGWAGSPLVLQLNGASPLSIGANGAATFSTKLSSTAPYDVTVLTQPAGPPPQICTIANGSGVIANSNITNVTVSCVSQYSIGVTVGGLAGQGLTLLLNGTDPLSISANGSATFSSLLASGASYSITVKTQPTMPTQTCTLSNAAGTVASANVSNVTVVCPLIYIATQKGDWTWMSVPGKSQTGVYGTQAVPSPLNYPGGRYGASSWTDSAGNLWLFGGFGFASMFTTLAGSLDDLWKYTPSAGTWEWVSGSQSTGAAAVYGTKGVPSSSNTPGARFNASTWTDHSGNLWLFGGSDGNDLWMYNPSAGTWEWVSGSDTPGAIGVYGAQGTPAAGNVPGARFGASSWIDAAGNLWLFGGTGYDAQGNQYQNNDLWEYNPPSGLWTWMSGSVGGTDGAGPPGVYGTKGVASASNVPGGRSYAVTWTDTSGNLWLFGGSGTNFTSSDELNDLWKYSPSAGTWEWVDGSDTPNVVGVYGTQGVAASGNVPGARQNAVAWTDSAGNFWLFGGYGLGSSVGAPSSGFDFLNDLWLYNPSAGTWEWVKGSNLSTVAGGGVIGTSGVPASANTPGGLGGAASWTDSAGNLWLFGGEVYGIEEYFNDLWVYTPLAP